MSATDHLERETDPRFPSGPWLGYFLQRLILGRHKMELSLTFRGGSITGEGRDWVGSFSINGRYRVDDGECVWTKHYFGRHDVFYRGFNEGRGIWGGWEIPRQWRTLWLRLHNGFHIWPASLGAASPLS